jgi:hypothetical protein
MNEIDIIQQQLGTERLHLSQVANACAAALDSGSLTAGGEFTVACANYFAFAITRVAPGARGQVASKLESARAGTPAAERWREFLRAFADDASKHFAALDAALTRNLPVTQWRAVSKIDADSIFAERELYDRVKSTLPPGIALASSTVTGSGAVSQ